MAFDGAFLYCLKAELSAAIGSHIDKIYQPSRDELVLALRKKGFFKRLLISAKGGMARLQFTEDIPENPDKPPTFCQLARKHLSAAYFEDIKLYGFERVADLCFSATNEMGDRVKLKIVCELIGGSPNAVLLSESGRVLDALHRTDLESSRIIVPGSIYKYPEPQNKLNIFEAEAKEIAQTVVKKGGMLSSAMLKTLSGLSPLISREMAYNAFGDDIELLSEVDINPIINSINGIKTKLISGGTPTLLTDNSGKPCDFTFTDINQYGAFYKKTTFESYGKLLDTFYGERERINRISAAGSDVIKTVKNLLSRAERRKAARTQELEQCKDREKLRIYGELIKANIHAVKAGSTFAVVQNFYEEDLKEIKIPLDPSLNAPANAAKYFKEYKKSYNAEQALIKLIENDNSEIEYLSSVEESLSRIKTLSDVNEIREELINGGYIRQYANRKQPKKKNTFNPLEYEHGGFKILVGKNNVQNDYITLTLAKKGDIWFHTKNIHGAHAVIFTGGKAPDDETLLFAAKLAAKNSKAASSSNVPVDYTDIKYVKKPSGAKAGMVIYTNNKTLFVTPEDNL